MCNVNDFKKSYIRIVEQEKFVQAACDIYNEQVGDIDLRKEMDEKFGSIQTQNIENVIKEHDGDIEWWKNSLKCVEKRFAYSVKSLVNKEPGLIDHLKEEIYKIGQDVNPEYKDKSVYEIYELIRDLLLDGGVEDEFNKIVNKSDNEVVWTRDKSPTQKYWTHMNVDFNKYYLMLRRAFIWGLLEKTDVKFQTLDDSVFVLKR